MSTGIELVIAGLVGGSGGAFITAFLRTRAEREEQVRERMIIAADELVTGFVQTFISMGRL